MKLLIFGNGLDLWLELPTKFSDFKKFLELEEYKNKYSNYYNLLNKIAYAKEDYEWNKLEDDMLSWLIENIDKTDLLTELTESDIDVQQALNEKNISLCKWIEQLNINYKSEIEQLQKFLKDRCPNIDNGAFIWTFNYIIDYYKPWLDNVYEHLRIQTKKNDNVNNKRMFSQCHFFGFYKSKQEIKLGANYKILVENVKNLDEIVKNDDKKCLIMILTKFCQLTINNKWEILNDPIKNMYEDIALNLPHFLWTKKKQIFEICFLGFSFGEQDDIYFSNEAKYSPLKYCNNFKYTYYKNEERNEIGIKLRSYNHKANIIAYKMDELLKDIFGNDGYDKLCKIQSKIKQKKHELKNELNNK